MSVVGLKVLSWNVLAAPWASPQWYADSLDDRLLDRHTRCDRIGTQLRALAPDVACLQETTPPDLATLVANLDPFDTHFASNGPTLWANWGSDATPWEPNGTAVLWRTDRFSDRQRGLIDLGEHGNVATFVDLVDRATKRAVRVVSVHLDSDDPDRRRAEILALLAACASAPLVVIAGDYNEDTIVSGSDRQRIGDPFFESGFVDALASLGRREPTHPYARPGDSWATLATIDHVLVRGLTPRSANVIDAETWSIETPEARMAECLRRTGSDHLALVVDLD